MLTHQTLSTVFYIYKYLLNKSWNTSSLQLFYQDIRSLNHITIRRHLQLLKLETVEISSSSGSHWSCLFLWGQCLVWSIASQCGIKTLFRNSLAHWGSWIRNMSHWVKISRVIARNEFMDCREKWMLSKGYPSNGLSCLTKKDWVSSRKEMPILELVQTAHFTLITVI